MGALKRCILLIAFLPPGFLRADPAVIENFDYKINLSETLPGVDSAPVTLGGPVVNVDVTDKLKSTTTRFPLKVYAVNQYFLEGGKLNLLCRSTPRDQSRQLYTFLQLDLTDPSESRQFTGLKKEYFSPDHSALLAVIDQGDKPDAIGLIRLGKGPAGLAWLYSEQAGVNLFSRDSQGLDGNLRLASAAGWSADSRTLAFLLSGKEWDGGNHPPSYYLACLVLEEDRFRAAVKEADLSAFAIPEGGSIDRIECAGDKATLYFPPKNLSDKSQLVLALPQPTPLPKKEP